MLNVIIYFNFDIDENCHIKDFLLKFHFLFNKILINRCIHNTDYDFLNFKIVINFIYWQIYADIKWII